MLTIREDFNGSAFGHLVLPFVPRPSSLQKLRDHFVRAPLRGIEAKDHVFTEGDPKSHVYQVVTGAVCLYKVLPDGRRQVLDFAYDDDILSLSLGATEAFNAQATVATRLKSLPVSELSALAMRDPIIAMGLYEALSAELAAMREHLICVVQRSATERVVMFLLSISTRNEARGRDPQIIELRMTRGDIGDFLGLTIETVSRTLTKLKCLGLIEITQGTSVRLRDIGGLAAIADGCSGEHVDRSW